MVSKYNFNVLGQEGKVQRREKETNKKYEGIVINLSFYLSL